MTSQALSLDCSDETESHSFFDSASQGASDGSTDQRRTFRVSHKTDADLRAMTPVQILGYILQCAGQAQAAQMRYELHGNFADAGERDAWIHAEAHAMVVHGSRVA